MGQYYNQPDFGTEAKVALPTDIIAASTNLKGSCLYVGTAGDVAVIMSGKFGTEGQYPVIADKIIFKNVPAGSILPVVFDFLVSTGTTASNFVTLK